MYTFRIADEQAKELRAKDSITKIFTIVDLSGIIYELKTRIEDDWEGTELRASRKKSAVDKIDM